MVFRQVCWIFSDHDETATEISEMIKHVLDSSGLDLSFMSAYCADNVRVNYGKHLSVYQLFKKENSGLIAASCPAYTTHSCAKFAADQLIYDMETVIVKIFNNFSVSAKRAENSRETFEFLEIECVELVRCTNYMACPCTSNIQDFEVLASD